MPLLQPERVHYANIMLQRYGNRIRRLIRTGAKASAISGCFMLNMLEPQSGSRKCVCKKIYNNRKKGEMA